MIILLNDNLFSSEIEDKNLLNWQRFMSAAIRSAECGHHLFILNPALHENIKNLKNLNEHAKIILSVIARKSLFIFEELKDKYRISFNFTQNDIENELENGVGHKKDFEILKMDLDCLNKALQPSHILLEDINDDLIYSQILKSYISHLKITSHHHYKIINGGGRGSYRFVDITIDENFNLFSIFDNDKKHPSDNIGETARLIIAEFEKHGLNKNYYMLDCQEVENLLPLDAYKNKADKNQQPTVSFIENAITINELAYLYFDFKKSHKYGDIFTTENDFSNFWRQFYSSCKNSCEHIETIKALPNVNSHLITPKLSTVAGLILSDLASGDFPYTDLENIRPTQLKTIWIEIGKIMHQWTISGKKIMI